MQKMLFTTIWKFPKKILDGKLYYLALAFGFYLLTLKIEFFLSAFSFFLLAFGFSKFFASLWNIQSSRCFKYWNCIFFSLFNLPIQKSWKKKVFALSFFSIKLIGFWLLAFSIPTLLASSSKKFLSLELKWSCICILLEPFSKAPHPRQNIQREAFF